MSDKVLNLVGLAHRAGKTVCGAQAAEQQIKKNGAALLFLASDSGPTNDFFCLYSVFFCYFKYSFRHLVTPSVPIPSPVPPLS